MFDLSAFLLFLGTGYIRIVQVLRVTNKSSSAKFSWNQKNTEWLFRSVRDQSRSGNLLRNWLILILLVFIPWTLSYLIHVKTHVRIATILHPLMQTAKITPT